MFDALIKIGGSLYHKPELPSCALAWSKLAAEYRLLLLPGGGPFADQVRAADARFRLGDDTAHWMAILAMDQFAYLLADIIPEATLVHTLEKSMATCSGGQAAILAPSALLLQLDPLPHSWQISSDSIAAWLARYAGIQRLILLKSVAGIFQPDQGGKPSGLLPKVSRQRLIKSSVVDPGFAKTLAPATQCWILDGSQPERLANLLKYGRTTGTRVVGFEDSDGQSGS